MKIAQARFLRFVAQFVLVCATLVALFWLVGTVWGPSWIKKSIEEYSQRVGYRIELQSVSVAPLALRVELTGLKLSQIGGNDLFTLERGVIALRWSKISVGEIGIQAVDLQSPRVLIEKSAQNKSPPTWNWVDFIQRIQTLSGSTKSSVAPEQPRRFSLEHLAIAGGEIKIRDNLSKWSDELGPFTLELRDLANYSEKNTTPSGIQTLYTLNLGKLDFDIPALGKKIAFDRVSAAGNVSSPKADILSVQLNLQLDDANIQSRFSFQTKLGELTGVVQIQKLALRPFVSLLPANSILHTQKGYLDADLTLASQKNTWGIAGDLRLLDTQILEGKTKEAFLQWQAIDLKRLDIRKTAQGMTSLAIDELNIDQPNFVFEINDQGFSNLRRMFSKPSTKELADQELVENANKSEAQAEIQVAQATTPPEKKFNLDIRSVKIHNGRVQFADYFVRPQFKTEINQFNGSLLGVSNTPGRYASIAFNGVMIDKGSMRARGQASFDDPRRNHDIAVDFKNLPLKATNPYFMSRAGYEIDDGSLDLILNYKAKDAELFGKNRIIIRNIQLGKEAPNFEGKRLPLGLAVILLEDSDKVIDISLDIRGNVDSPKFSASGLVWQAIRTVFTNIVTAPFRALASLFGIQGDTTVYSVVGENVFLPVDQDKLEKLASVLAKRPKANIELSGSLDPKADREALARAKADQAILSAAGFKVGPNEPLPIPSLSDRRIQAGLKSAYASQVGRIKLTQRLIMLPDNEARYQQLRSELIQSYSIGNAELVELASARAKNAKDLMTKLDPSIANRIVVSQPKELSANQDGVPLGLQMANP